MTSCKTSSGKRSSSKLPTNQFCSAFSCLQSKMFDDIDDTPVTLTINKSYANKYQTWREKEEKQKCKSWILFNIHFGGIF